MTQTESAQLNALLGSRICHDLISPLGAIGNGVELLQMSGMGNSAEMSLISDSVAAANTRVRLFRIAFGAADPGQMLSRSELVTVARTVGADRRMRVEWSPPEQLPRLEGKLAILLLLVAESCLPFGGDVRVVTAQNRINIALTAPRMREDLSLLDHLRESSAPLPGASEIHLPLARMAASDLGRRITVSKSAQRLEFTA